MAYIPRAADDARYIESGEAASGDLAGTYPGPTLAVDRVRKTGDTMSNFLTLHADPTAALHASTKQFAETTAKRPGYYYGIVNGGQNIPSNSNTGLGLIDQEIDPVYCTKMNLYEVRLNVAGYWLFSGNVYFSSGAVGTQRAYIQWAVGNWPIGRQSIGTNESWANATAMSYITAGTAVNLAVYQLTGAAMSTGADQQAVIKWLGP